MADQEQLAILERGAIEWNKWRESHKEAVPNLYGSKLADRDLQSANFVNANLGRADLSRAKLSGCMFTRANLRETTFHDTDLTAIAGSLDARQLGGADLTGAKLPEALKDLFKDLGTVKEISDNAQKLFIAMLAACLYSWLTVATTTDANLVTDRASSPLPIIQTSIPIEGFYIITPLLLLGVYFYFHFYLQKLWDELGSLPAIFSDGIHLQSKADPWLLSDLVQAHVAKLRSGRPFLSHLQKWISILLAWWFVPVTLLLFWLRYLPRHDVVGTAFHSILTGISVVAAVCLYKLAREALTGTAPRAACLSRNRYFRPDRG
jgi:Pentapeptide repeats (8 copies)